MPRIDSAAAERRALYLFERLTSDPGARAGLTASEPADVLSALERLERAEQRSRQAFPTVDDDVARRVVMPIPDGVGSYRFTGVLGEGGMGIVFAAERNDGLFDHRVAIKLIHPDRLTTAGLARFEQERRLLARLDHPNIARLIDGGVTGDGWPYIIMERIDGGPIDEHVRDAGLDQRERVLLLIAVGKALRAAHTTLVVHGDIKPDNILIHRDGQPRLLDFGVARLADADDSVGFEPRTLAFSSPERRDGEAPTIASDIFGFGVVMRCLLGRGDGDRPQTMTIADRDLAAIAAKATAVLPADRYGAVDALVTDLERWTAGLPVLARPLTLRYVTARFIARHRVGVTGAGVGLAVLAGTLLIAVQGWREAQIRASDLRDLTRYQLVDLDRRLDALPRTVALRVALASEAQRYLDRLAREPSSTPTLKRDAADGFRRLALLQGASDRPSLGNAAAARISFARAEALLDHDATAATAKLRARILIDHARMEIANENIAAAGLLARRSAAMLAAAPASLVGEHLLLRSEIAQWDGKFAEAQALAARGRNALEPVADGPVRALLLARGFDLEAEANYYAERTGQALAGYRAALAVLTEAAGRWPGNRALHWSLTKARWALGTAELGVNHAAIAVPLLDAAYRASLADAANDPADRVARRRQRTMTLALGQALLGDGQRDAGIALIERSVAERGGELARHPEDAVRARDWLVGVAALGDAFVALHRTDDACRVYAKAHAMVEGLTFSDKLTPLDRKSIVTMLTANRVRDCGSRSSKRT